MFRKYLSIIIVLFAATAVADDGRYIVELRDARGGARALAQAGAEVLLELPRHNAVAAHIPAAAVAALRSNPNIVSIEDDPRRYPLAQTVPYGIPMVQANQVSEGVGKAKVCIIDSGYYTSHEDLPNAHVTGSDGNLPWNVDGCGHGTHVAGTIAAVGNGVGVVGVNPSGNIDLHIVRVFGNDCAWAYSSSLVAALDACPADTRVVSMSLGGGVKSRFEQRSFDDAYKAGVLSIAAAGNDGNNRMSYPASYSSVVSVAAVDANKNVADFSQYNAQVELAAPGVGVLSTVPYVSDTHLSAGGSTYGANHIEFSAFTGSTGVSGPLVNGGLCDTVGSWSGQVVLCERGSISFYDKVVNARNGGGVAAVIYNNAPGNFLGTLGDGNSSTIPGISLSQEDGQTLVAGSLGTSGTVVATEETAGSGYEAWDGTSMATPHVSGVAALVWSNFPTATNQQIRDALDATAEDRGSPGRDYYYGYGIVRAKAAYDYLGGTPACTPTENPEQSCGDGFDNDCDGLVDVLDPDCGNSGGGTCSAIGDICSSDADCCSLKCKGRAGALTCR